MDVVVLDGNQRSALAVTRSLGKRGITVLVGAETKPSLASSSIFCGGSFTYPSPCYESEGFLHVVKEVTSRCSPVILIPMTDVTVDEILALAPRLGPEVHLPFVGYTQYEAASDKSKLFRLAKNLKTAIPKTMFSCDFGTVEELVQEAVGLGFPLVLKPARSRIKTAQGWVNASVRYLSNQTELKKSLHQEPFSSFPFLIQERITGPGIGIFLLMDKGQVLAHFSHRRIREKPPSGGVSVLCKSIQPPATALEGAVRLLRELNWSGVAMVEFKWDEGADVPKLMEINGRFWGSLQLAVSAGVDFPYLLYCLATGERIDVPRDYRLGVCSRWELGDLDHLYLRLAKRSSKLDLPADAPSCGRVLWDFVGDFFSPSVKNEVFKSDDVRPFLFELRGYLKQLIP